jgi:DNA-binding transcriptional ArsR family regulator
MNRAVTVRVSRKLFDYQAKLTAYIHIIKYVVMKTRYSRALPKEWKPMSDVFTALGDEHRQRMLLLFEKGERLNVGRIVEVSPLSRSAVSHHLKVLRQAGVLRSEKVGKEVYFWIDVDYVGRTLRNVLDHITENH